MEECRVTSDDVHDEDVHDAADVDVAAEDVATSTPTSTSSLVLVKKAGT